MRQFYHPSTDILTKGIYPTELPEGNGKYLTDCVNLKPTVLGLMSTELSRLIVNEDAQLFETKLGTLVVTANKLYKVTDPTLTELLSFANTTVAWSIADFDAFIALTNGVITILYQAGAWSLHDNSLVPLSDCICAVQGARAILGGVGADKSKVAWSEIGAMKFLLDTDTSTLYKNSAGFRFMPGGGEVLSVLPLGNRVCVFGSAGVFALVPAVVEPVGSATYGLQELSAPGVGVGSRRCAALMRDGIGYINLNNELCIIGKDLTHNIIGYKGLLDYETAIISCDRKRNELYIEQDGITYILTKYGLGRTDQSVKSVVYSPIAKSTRFIVPSPLTQTYAEFTSDVSDFGLIGVKTIADFSIQGTSLGNMYGCVEYQADNNAAFAQTPWRQFSPQGFCFIGISGTAFRFKVRINTYTNSIHIRDFKVGVQYMDKRFIKGAVLDDSKIIAKPTE